MKRQKTVGPARKSAWRVWLLEPLLWVCFFLASLTLIGFGIEFLPRLGLSSLWVAGFAYTAIMPAFLLSPGRGSPGYNPFGPVVRLAAPRLAGVHLVCLPIFLAIVALHERTSPSLRFLHSFAVLHPDLTDFGFIGGPVLLAIAQGVRSYGILEDARDQLSGKRRAA